MQTLVSALVGGIVMFGLITMNVNSFKANRTVETNTKVNDLMALLKMQLGSDLVCEQKLLPYLSNSRAFTVTGPETLTVSRIDEAGAGATPPLMQVGGSLPGINNVILDAIRLEGITPVPSTAVPNSFQGKLVFEITKSGVIGSNKSVASLPIFLKTNQATGVATIIGCSIQGSMTHADLNIIMEKNCQSIGGTWDGNTCNLDNIKNQMCASLGGAWDGTNCNNIRVPASVAGPVSCPAGTVLVNYDSLQNVPVNIPNPAIHGTNITVQQGGNGSYVDHEFNCNSGTWNHLRSNSWNNHAPPGP